MDADAVLTELTRTIQIAIAPVFLMTALGTILSVLSARLARIVDRARFLNDRVQARPGSEHPGVPDELASLRRRRIIVNYAITSATVAALLVCLLIVTVFVGFISDVRFPLVIAGLFIAAMGACIAALVLFLKEISLAVHFPGLMSPPPLAGDHDHHG